jgi:hypothetical protein
MRSTHLRAAALAAALLILPAASSEAATFKPISAKGFKLKRSGLGAASYARVARMEQVYPRVGVAGVLADTNRQTRSIAGSPVISGVRNFAGGFRWNEGDDNFAGWYPQGLTGSADASDSGSVAGHRVLVASWYSKEGKGVRASFVNADSLDGARYRHVLLVAPGAKGGYGLVKIHAGGIAWYGNLLYVADTDNGVRVFDTSHLMLVRKGGGRRKKSLDYKYLLPQVGAYRTTGKKLRYSFVAIDRTTTPPTLLAGEYRAGKAGGRIVRWRLNAKTGRIARGRAVGAVRSPASNVQGALSVGGRFYTSSSNGNAHGTLASGKPRGRVSTTTWGIGPEDLTYSRLTNRLYTLTEHPGLRTVFGVGL